MQLQAQDTDLGKLVFLIHRRAFWKIGWWVQIFGRQWGMLLFSILKDCLNSVLEHSASWMHAFTVRLEMIKFSLMKKFVEAEDAAQFQGGVASFGLTSPTSRVGLPYSNLYGLSWKGSSWRLFHPNPMLVQVFEGSFRLHLINLP